MSSTPTDSEGGSDWEGEEAMDVVCQCIFCSKELEQGANAVLEHCTVDHEFDLMSFIKERGMQFYVCIKLINFIRKENVSPSQVMSAVSPFPWEDDCYLQPVIVDDPLLQLDFEPTPADSNPSSHSDVDLGSQLTDMEKQVAVYKEALSRAHVDLESMRSAVQAIVLDGEPQSTSDSSSIDLDSDGYFHSYSHHSIHEEMLKDEVRTETYRIFIERNPELFKDKVVLDVGCGTGVLSMFAAQAGAKRVYGVDQSSIVYKAMDIVRENGFEDRITLIRGKVEEVQLPVDKVDIIISEWMGYFLLFESMLDTVIFARDKWLKDQARVFPNVCSISLVALGNKYDWDSKIRFWDCVYGFKMSCMKEEVLRDASVTVVDQYSIISSSDTVKKFDLSTTGVSDLEFEAYFELTVQSDTLCHAFAGYFDIGFEQVPNLVHMSTSPRDEPTHWKQTVFYLAQPFQVNTGDLIKGSIRCNKIKSDPRSLEVTVSYELDSFISESQPIKSQQKYFLR